MPPEAGQVPRQRLQFAQRGVKSLRPNAQGIVHSPRQGEPTVEKLYEFVKKHKQKNLAEATIPVAIHSRAPTRCWT